jgi:hypothetical protein
MERFYMAANEVYGISIRKFLNYTVSYRYVMQLIRQTIKSVPYIRKHKIQQTNFSD